MISYLLHFSFFINPRFLLFFVQILLYLSKIFSLSRGDFLCPFQTFLIFSLRSFSFFCFLIFLTPSGFSHLFSLYFSLLLHTPPLGSFFSFSHSRPVTPPWVLYLYTSDSRNYHRVFRAVQGASWPHAKGCALTGYYSPSNSQLLEARTPHRFICLAIYFSGLSLNLNPRGSRRVFLGLIFIPTLFDFSSPLGLSSSVSLFLG